MSNESIFELAYAYADAVSTHRLESLYGTSKGYTLEKARERDEAHSVLVSELRRLVAENESLRKDAERYRWLRDSADCDEGIAPMHQLCSDWGRFYWSQVEGDDLDAAIDAAKESK